MQTWAEGGVLATHHAQRPRHQHRLEEQPRQACLVGLQAEGVVALHVLGHIAREDRHERRRGEPPS